MKKRLTIAIYLLAVFCLDVWSYTDHRNTKTDSIETVLNSPNPPKGEQLLECYLELIRGYLGHDTEKHESYCKKALELSYDVDRKNARESVLYHYGLHYYGQSQYEKAEYYYRWALAVTDSMVGNKRYSESDIDNCRSQLYGAMGNLYNLQDKYLLAIEWYQKALPIFEKHGWLESQTILNHNIAELYLSMGNLEKAEHHWLQAIRTGKASGDSLMTALPRKGLTNVYLAQQNYNKVHETLLPAYHYFHAHRQEEPGGYPEVLALMVKMHLMDQHEDIAKAKEYAQEALNLVTEDMMAETRQEIFIAATMVAIKEQHWQQALSYAQKSIHQNDEEATYSDVGCYEMLANIYMHLGQNDKAFEYIQKMRAMMERFATHDYQSGLSQMEVLYKTKEKEAQINALNKERALFRWLLAVAIGLLIALALLFVYRLQTHRRQKELLTAKVALDTETKERHILARDLHDSLGSMLSLLRLKLERKDDGTMDLLDKAIHELRRTAHHLMPEELLKVGLSSALHDFAVSLPEARFQAIGDINLSKDIELVLYRCAYELVNNAIKHAQANHIDIQLMQEPQQVTLSVSDNGTGTKTINEGMGLHNIRERIATYHGTINIVSTQENGTEINITIPL